MAADDVEPPLTSEAEAALSGGVRRALKWGTMRTVLARVASFLSGIVLARVLVPDDFGGFAVALTITTIALALNDFGMHIVLVRSNRDLATELPTGITIIAALSLLLFVVGFVFTPALADAFGVHGYESTIRITLLGVLIDGFIIAGCHISLARDFRQDLRFRGDAVAVVASAAVSIGLAARGWGAMSLAMGHVAGLLVLGAVLWVITPNRVRPGFDSAVARSLLTAGGPIAGATLLGVLLANVDFMVVGSNLGGRELGFYALAFNLSSWPVTLVGQPVREAALPAFARLSEDPGRVGTSASAATVGLAVALLPVCAALTVLAPQLVQVIYGEEWTPAAEALRVLALFGFFRLISDLLADVLHAVHRSSRVLLVNGLWLLVVAPVLYLQARWNGISGVAVGHLIVLVLVVLPLLVRVLRSGGIVLRANLRRLGLGLWLSAAVAGCALAGAALFDRPIAETLVGGGAGAVLWALTLVTAKPWVWWSDRT